MVPPLASSCSSRGSRLLACRLQAEPGRLAWQKLRRGIPKVQRFSSIVQKRLIMASGGDVFIEICKQ